MSQRDSFLRYSGGNDAGVPPLPIPNRAVKPGSADGTAQAGEQEAAVLDGGSFQSRIALKGTFFVAPPSGKYRVRLSTAWDRLDKRWEYC